MHQRQYKLRTAKTKRAAFRVGGWGGEQKPGGGVGRREASFGLDLKQKKETVILRVSVLGGLPTFVVR